MFLAQRKWIITAQYHIIVTDLQRQTKQDGESFSVCCLLADAFVVSPVNAYHLKDSFKRFCVVNQRINPESSKVRAWIVFVVDCAQLGPHRPTVLDASDRAWERTTAVCKAESELRVFIQNTTEYQ